MTNKSSVRKITGKAGSSVPPPAAREKNFCVVGLGASAGGLDAYRHLLAAMPTDTGMGFVVIQHMAADHASSLAEILGRSTSMPVIEVKDEPRVQANHVYVIPPGKTMVIAKQRLKLQPREQVGSHHSIDLFFKALAEDLGPRSIGVVLSGTANDGTSGLREIKAVGGITFAQDDSAQHSGMPRSAIAAQCVDFVLPPQRIAEEIARIAQHPFIVPDKIAVKAAVDDEPDLSRILRKLHQVTDVDFGNYKEATIRRRIARRMMLHGLVGLADYAHLLEDTREEAAALFQDILIGVTGFFRDPQTFNVVQGEIFPRLLENRSRGDPLRMWVPGCSTGEEAYSYAIAAAEFMEARSLSVPIQVFASDLNAASIDKARRGLYPKSIGRDVSAARLGRYFVEIDGNYQISKAVRDCCVFAVHNLAQDPPFSRLDLVSCRNVLIYLAADLQKRLFPQLHYALNPEGYLVLGSSESIGSHRRLFEPYDAKRKIYRKAGGADIRAPNLRRKHAMGATSPVRGGAVRAIEADIEKKADLVLLSRYAPASVVVDQNLEILQSRGDLDPYLAPAGGKASLNLLRMARPGLAVPIRQAVLKAKQQGTPVRNEKVRVKIEGAYRRMSIEVVPFSEENGKTNGFLVLLESSDAPAVRTPAALPWGEERARSKISEFGRESANQKATRLAEELEATREYLQSVIDQQEVANEELQAAAEEAQSSNEELQSVNEEMETAKEEIQATNEELTTLNDELQHRNQETSRLNDDLRNLFGSIEVVVVIVGRDLRIRSFTPLAEKALGLGPDDVGRSLADVKTALELPRLDETLNEVIHGGTGEEMEVQDEGGTWYSMRVRPYKTSDGKIDGAVLVLVDIDVIRRARELAENIVSTVREPLVVLDRDLRVRSASRAFYESFGLSAEQTQNQLLFDIGDGSWNTGTLRSQLVDILPLYKSFEDCELEISVPGVGLQTVLVNARHLLQVEGAEPLILMSIEIATQRKQFQDSQRQVVQLSDADRNRNEFLSMLAHELRNPLAPLQNALHLLRSPGADEDVRANAREMMERQIRILTRLVDELLDSARVTLGKIDLFLEPVELNGLLAGISQSVQPGIDRKQQTLRLSLLPSPVFVNGDPTRLEQSFRNLLRNASKFSPRGSEIEVTSELAHRRGPESTPDEVIVRVRDNGIGIGPEALPHVFDLFMQSDRGTGRPQGGLGIGLALTRKLVELHGGSVEARSNGLGQGSEFVVRLATVPPPATKMGSGNADLPALPAAMRKVLVIDDNFDAADSLAVVLRLAGHTVTTAYGALDGLQKASQLGPEVIILDIGLPEIDGYEVARRIRKQPTLKGALLIALTGHGSDEDRRLGADAGFDHHFVKPVDSEVMARILERRGHRP